MIVFKNASSGLQDKKRTGKNLHRLQCFSNARYFLMFLACNFGKHSDIHLQFFFKGNLRSNVNHHMLSYIAMLKQNSVLQVVALLILRIKMSLSSLPSMTVKNKVAETLG